MTDFRELNGRDILIVKKAPPDIAPYAPYFRRVEIRQFDLRGVTFYFVLGYDFDYGNYKRLVLRPIKDKYYKIPAFSPPCSLLFL
ncbi:MAG: hypothetical protein WDM70_10185 [Nitrosomonadales bacterium]